MLLTKVQKAKLTAEIDKLTKKANQIVMNANAQQRSFYDSALTYGSELAGSSGTEQMYKEVTSLREMTKFLKAIKNGVVSLGDHKRIATRLDEIQQNINSLVKQKENLEVRLQYFRRLQKILSS